MATLFCMDRKFIRQIFTLAWPVMMGMLLQTFLSTVDLYFVAKLGKTEAAALSLGGSTFGTIIVFSALITTGVMAMIARRTGEGDHEAVVGVIGAGTLLAIALGAFIGLLAIMSAQEVIQFLYDTGPVITQKATSYLQVIFAFIPFIFISNVMRSSLQGMGDTKSPLVIFGLANLLNMILDPFFIFTLDLGIQGAAYATGISIALGTLGAFLVLYQKDQVKKAGNFFVTMLKGRRYMVNIIKIGFWDMLQQTARPITGMLMFRIVYQVGKEEATAAFGIGGQLFGYTFIFLTGLAIVISVLVGQMMGAGRHDEVNGIIKNGTILATINILLFGILYLGLPKQILSFFIDDPRVIEIGVSYLRIVYIGIAFTAITIVISGALKGAGYTLGPMMASLVANVAFKLPVAAYLASKTPLSINGVWIAIALSVVVEAGILLFYFFYKPWRNTQV